MFAFTEGVGNCDVRNNIIRGALGSSVIPREVLKTEYDQVDRVDRTRSHDETASARRDAFATGEGEPRLFH